MSRKKMALLFWGSVLILTLLTILVWLFYFRLRAYTDDSYVEGNQVFITPLVDGFVTAIHTDDTYLVKKGQLLIELDKTDAAIALDKARRDLAAQVRSVSEMFHQVFVYQAEIEIKRAEFIKTAQDFQHREEVIARAGVSLEDFEHATAAFKASFYSLWMSETLYEKALSAVQGTAITTHPLVRREADKLRLAWVHLHRCNIFAPVEGLAAQRTIQVGMWVEAGKPLLSVIPLNQIWVNANFKETQLKHMRIGQSVRMRSDLYGTRVLYHGRVAGLPGGAGNAFSLLPPQNLSGNWIKIVQRLPVRVELDPEEIKQYPLRVGLSMESWVNLLEEGQLVPTTNAGSPCYATPIFENEEEGSEATIAEIVSQNMDPTLLRYACDPLQIECATTSTRKIDPTLEALKNYALKLVP